ATALVSPAATAAASTRAAAGLGRRRTGWLAASGPAPAPPGHGVGARFFCSSPSQYSSSLRQPGQNQGGVSFFRSRASEHANDFEGTLSSLQAAGGRLSGGAGGAGHDRLELQRPSPDRTTGPDRRRQA